MKKHSVLAKILILVLFAFLIPATFGQDPACWAPYCVDSCPAGTYDCTMQYMTSSWDAFFPMLGMYWNGYTPLVCWLG